MIYIYFSYISKENHENLCKEELPKFSIDFQEKVKRFKRWQDAQLSLLGRILLFNGIKANYNYNPNNDVIKYTRFNKPYFENSNIHFNISHSGEIVVCAFSDQFEIGIDIEIVSDIIIDDYKFQMTQNEWSEIVLSNNQEEMFFKYWSKKEAVIKACGHGLSIPLKSFEIKNNKTKINEEIFYLKAIRIDKNYKCYISQKEKFKTISLKKIKSNQLI